MQQLNYSMLSELHCNIALHISLRREAVVVIVARAAKLAATMFLSPGRLAVINETVYKQTNKIISLANGAVEHLTSRLVLRGGVREPLNSSYSAV